MAEIGNILVLFRDSKAASRSVIVVESFVWSAVR